MTLAYVESRRIKRPQDHDTMTRQTIDCRDLPSDIDCTVAVSADAAGELLDAAVDHAVKVHGYTDDPHLRTQLNALAKAA